jgi:hypothetical protein
LGGLPLALLPRKNNNWKEWKESEIAKDAQEPLSVAIDPNMTGLMKPSGNVLGSASRHDFMISTAEPLRQNIFSEELNSRMQVQNAALLLWYTFGCE